MTTEPRQRPDDTDDTDAPRGNRGDGTRPIRFVYRDRVHEVGDLPAELSVLSWLREHQRCTGTKEGCNEGDCGACTVLVGTLEDSRHSTADHAEPHAPAGAAPLPRLRLAALNSCLLLLPMLDGKALFTVESLGGRHPAQDAMVACHGSQCGFCTPGFVMSLAGCYQAHQDAAEATRRPPSRQDLADALSGNLCRCTGYRPILDAAQAMFDAPIRPIDTAASAQALLGLHADPPLRYQPSGHAGQADGAAAFEAPQALDTLAARRLAHPQARLLAGNTDVGLWINKQFHRPPGLLWVGRVEALRQIQDDGPMLRIGAGVSLEQAWRALVARWPELREMHLRFASPPIRAAGTLGGNLANGSPIGDGAPVLMALDAQLLLRRGDQQRQLPLDAFYLGYQRQALEPGEFIEALLVPLPRDEAPFMLRAYKHSLRHDSDISAVACGLALRLDAQGHIALARLAWGGLAATVRRATQAESALQGQPWDATTLARAQDALARDFQPLSDLRASAGHRLRIARALLQRFWLATRPDGPLAPAQLSVWTTP